MEELLIDKSVKLNFVDLKEQELSEINGGEPLTAGAVCIAAAVGLGAVVVGCLVGYGIYRTIRWLTEK